MNEADVLEKAADLLETQGWCQDVYRNKAGELCSIGAVRTAIWGDARMRTTTTNKDDVELANRTLAVLADKVGVEPGSVGTEWNDDPWRTKEEVVDAFKHAAKDLRNQER